jgi:hypothetical protein
MSNALSAQHWDISHLNVPIRKMTKQSSLEDKEAYLKKGALIAIKMPQYSCMYKRRSIEASLSKPEGPIWQTG